MKAILFCSILVLSLICQSCFLNCIDGSDKPVIEHRTTGSYNSIEFTGSGNVRLVKGEPGKVDVASDDNVVRYLETKTSGNKLIITEKKCYNTGQPAEYLVRISDITSVVLSGSGTIVSDDTFRVQKSNIELEGSGSIKLNLIAEKLNTELSGSGEISLSGRADKQEISLSGSGEMNAFGLHTFDTRADLSGSGVCRIFAENSIDVSLSGSGDVFYKGKPKSKKTNITGSGNIEESEK